MKLVEGAVTRPVGIAGEVDEAYWDAADFADGSVGLGVKALEPNV